MSGLMFVGWCCVFECVWWLVAGGWWLVHPLWCIGVSCCGLHSIAVVHGIMQPAGLLE